MLTKTIRAAALIAAVFGAPVAEACGADPDTMAGVDTKANIEAFLKGYLGSLNSPGAGGSVGFAAAPVPGTDMTVVFLAGKGICGDFGCTLMVVRPCGTSYRIESDTMMALPPVSVLETKHNGMPDLSVFVRGDAPKPKGWGWYSVDARTKPDGYETRYQVGLPYDGGAYPGSATDPEAYKVSGQTGLILIDENAPLTMIIE